MELRLLALVCLVGAALAGPFSRDAESRCSTECNPTSNKFRYEEGKKYVYDYKGDNFISIVGGRKQQKSQITGKAEIHVLGNCEMVLQLRNMDIQSSGSSGEESGLIRKLEENPIHFSWSDGIIEHLCASPSETEISLNIKKAILSAIVNSMVDLNTFRSQKELDSLGTCDTHYSSRGEYQGTIKIHKEKFLKSCDNRHSGLAALIVNSYKSPESDINSFPIFTDEKLQCDQEIQQGIIRKVHCTERASFKPLSKHDSIAEFKGDIELSLSSVSVSRGTPSVHSMKSQDVLYSYAHEQDPESNEREAEEILSELCPITEGLLDPSVSKLYYRLIGAVRNLPEQSVERIYQALKSKSLCHSKKTLDIFLDTLPMAGTEGSIKLMVKLIQNREVTGLKAKLWPASLALIPHPTAGTIAALMPLLSDDERNSAVLLGASAMIHKICSSRNCDRIEAIKRFTAVLHSSLGERCSSDNEDEVMGILKAFGNMGYCGEACQSIIQCATSKSKSIPRRLAAIDSFRRNKGKLPQEIVNLFEDLQEDFEVRIAALVASVSHPDRQVIATIERVMRKETNEQVKAFTSSLMKNLKETSSPLKQEHRKLLENVEIHENDLSYWKNSKNIEFSAFNEVLNLGGSIESNIVHSPESSVPRSGTAKIDIDLFGKNINLLEVGVRAEGLEDVVKKLLGMHESESKHSWFSRSLQRSSGEQSKTEASFFLRTMDTELFDMSSSDLTSMGNMMQFADVFNKLAQGRNIDVAHSFMFVDSKIVVPSVTGRSYALSLSGTTSVGLTANGKFDVVNLMSSPKNCDIEGRFQPSANLELAATVGIQSESSRPDVKIVTLLHSETDVEAKLHVKDGHVLHAKWNLPSEKVELFKLSTNLYEVDSEGRETPIIDEMKTKIDHCIKSFVKPLGIEFCGKLEMPHPFVTRTFPFARGLGNVEMSIRKTDPSMQGFDLLVEMPRHLSDNMAYEVSLDTPGSSVKRKHSARLEIKKPSPNERAIKLHVETPFKEISSVGSYIWRPDIVQCSLQVITDQSRRYSGKATLEISTSGQHKSLKPTIQWSLPESEPVTISGTVSYVQGRKEQFMIDMKSNKPSSKPIAITGSIVKEGPLSLSTNSEWKLSTDLIAKTPWIAMKIRGSSEKQIQQSKFISSALSIDYKKENSPRHSIKFASKAQESSGRVSASAQFECTQMPFVNWRFGWDKQGSLKDSMKNDVILSYGRNPESSYFHVVQLSKRGGLTELSESKISMKAPQFGMDSELKVSGNLDFQKTSNFNVETDFRYSGENHIKSSLHLQHLSKKPLRMMVEAQLEFPGRKMAYKDEVEEVSPNEFSGNTMLQWQQGRQATLQYRYRKLSDRTKIHHEVESTLQAPFVHSPVHHKTSLKISRGSFEMDSSVSSNRNVDYSINAKINRRGSSELSFKVPRIECSMDLQNEEHKTSASLDLQYRFSETRRVKVTAAVGTSPKKSIELEILCDADRNPSQKISISTEIAVGIESSQRVYRMESRVQCLDAFSMDLASEGKASLGGPHLLSAELSSSSMKPTTVNALYSASSQDGLKVELEILKENSKKITVHVAGKYAKHSSGMDFTGRLSLSGGSFEKKELIYSHSHLYSPSSLKLNCHMQFQQSPSKIYAYQFSLEGNPKESIDLKLSLTTPLRRFERQQVRISVRRDDDGHTAEASIEYGSSKRVTMSSSCKKIRQGMSHTISMTTPHSLCRDAEFHVSYDYVNSPKWIQSHLKINKRSIYETELSFHKQSRSFEIRSHMKCAYTSEYDGIIKSRNDRDSFSHEVLVTKDSRKMISSKISKQATSGESIYSFEVQDSRRDLMNIKASREVRGSNTKHAFEATGPFNPITIKLQMTKNERNSVSLTASVCHGETGKECCHLKGYSKTEQNPQKSRNYRKITLDLEHISSDSITTHMGNIHYLLDDQERSLKSKLLIEAQNKRFGYDLSLSKITNEDDTGSLEVSVILPVQTIRVTGSALRNSEKRVYEIEIVPDVSSPSKKLSASLKSEWESGRSSQQRELSGVLRINHEILEKPIEIGFSVLKSGDGKWPIGGKVEVDYSRDPGEKLTTEMKLLTEGGHPGKPTFVYRFYRQDRKVDFTVNVIKHSVDSKKLYGWNWIWATPDSENKTGGLLVTVSDVQNTRSPTTFNVTYFSSRCHAAILGEISWIASFPRDVKVKMYSKEEMIGEAEYHNEGQCSIMEIRQSSSILKNRMCVEKTGSGNMKHMKIESYCHERKCADVSIDFDPSHLQAANVEMKWEKRDLVKAMTSLKNMSSTLCRPMTEGEESDMILPILEIISSVCEKVVKPVKIYMRNEIDRLLNDIRHYLEQIKQRIIELHPCEDGDHCWTSVVGMMFTDRTKLVQHLCDSAQSKWSEMRQKVVRSIPDEVKDWWNKVKEEIQEYIDKHCSRGTFCYQVQHTYKRRGMTQARKLIQNKLTEVAKTSTDRIMEATKWMPNVWEKVKDMWVKLRKVVKEKMPFVFENALVIKLADSLEKTKNWIVDKYEECYRKIKEMIDEISESTSKNDDVKILKSIFTDAKEEIQKAWKELDLINWMKRMPKAALDALYPSEWINEKFSVESDIPHGSFRLHMHHPFDYSKINVVKSAFYSFRNKLQHRK